ncbi:MAG: 30S ribosomal protein S3 [Butyricicoccaceae bacterium]
MGQKVNPHGLRVGVIKGWDSRWFAKDELVGDLLVEDYNIRKHLKKQLYAAGVPQIEIERTSANVRIIIHCAKPGMIVGKGGADIQKLEQDMTKMIGKPVKVSIVEVRNPDLNAQLVAENIASQLERRISFRRAMKQSIARAMRLGAKGIKVTCSGRLGGAEIARVEHYHEGTIPLQTLRADIEYGFAEADTTYGRIGVKVWLYKGEVLTGGPRQSSVEAPRRDRRDRRDGDRRNNNRNGDRRGQGDRRSQGSNRGQGNNGRPYRQNNGGNRPAAPKQEGGAQ